MPPNSGRVWVSYSFDPGPLEGWSVGVGLYAASGAYVDLANVYETSAYYTIDANVSYQMKNFKGSLTAKNLTGEDYYVPYNYYGGRIAPGDARGFYAKARLDVQVRPPMDLSRRDLALAAPDGSLPGAAGCRPSPPPVSKPPPAPRR